jgi:tetratricopeptide (TPR) repeat protein
MCFWGEAISLGPNINYRMPDSTMLPALVAVARAVKNEAHASPKERALIEAARARYSADQKATREGLDNAYADAMLKVHTDYPDDADIATLFAEAAMDATHPWWLPPGRVANGRMADAVRALEAVLHAHPDHPGAIHYYVHIMEGSAWTKIAEPYADKLAALMPAAGHIVHMPAHIYFALGRYKDALAANLAAIAADEKYFNTVSAFDANYYGLFAHNLHFGLEAADMAGDGANALALAAKLRDSLPEDFLRSKFYAQRNLAAAYFAPLRFSTPDEILALPKPNDDFAFLTAFWHYARGSAYALKGDLAHAGEELTALDDLRGGPDIKAISVTAQGVPKVLDVADAVLRARIAVAQHKWSDAIVPLEHAIAIEDDVGYAGDPPWWDNPLRQSLGIVLLKAGKPRDAIDTLRKALIVAPNDGTALYALRDASTAIGDTLGADHYGRLFEKAWVGPKPPDLDRL